uniref:Uncharacterized protein n=1 Tax=Avena sativa TaxID=4498 RepID=A0ACD6AHK4_AVESA
MGMAPLALQFHMPPGPQSLAANSTHVSPTAYSAFHCSWSQKSWRSHMSNAAARTLAAFPSPRFKGERKSTAIPCSSSCSPPVGVVPFAVPAVGEERRPELQRREKMAAGWTSLGLVAVAVLVVGIAMPASAAGVQPPAPAPASDGTSIDQGIAYVLMLVALVLTYLIHPLDVSSPYRLF